MQASPVDGITLRFIEANGLRFRIAEIGEGPVVLLAHGWPESWYSWRHQMTALAAAGYRAVAPDMRGYGETDRPDPVEAYDIEHLTADVAGLADALGVDAVHLVGHDWGAIVAANTALFRPERLTSLTLMSVPYTGRSAAPWSVVAEMFGDDFFYISYHNEPGDIAEAEYDAAPRAMLGRVYQSPDSPRHDPEVTDPKRAAGGFMPRIGVPKGLPPWLTQGDLDYIVSQFEHAGFRGGVNYYRNLDRNWELTERFADIAIDVPASFIAGEQDMVIGGASAETLQQNMADSVVDLRQVTVIPEVGHWVQQEAPEQTNEALLEFLTSIDP